MSKRDANGPNINVGGDNSGIISFGDENKLTVDRRVDKRTTISAQDAAALQSLIANLREQVTREAPEDQRIAALSKVDELNEAIATKPSLHRMTAIRDWFAVHLPAMLGAVTSVFVDPLVGKIVEASGEIAADAFRKKFGISS
jgi:hypothetical protein